MTARDHDATRLMLVGELGDAVGLANEMVRGCATRIGVESAPAAFDGWTGPEADVVVVDLAVNLKDVLARLRGGRSQLSADGSVTASVSGLVGQNIADVERELILQTLRHCGGNRSAAAAMLGISVRTMRNKLRSFQANGMAVPPALAGVVRAEMAAGAQPAA
ncbi:helix-turn-helix domain-containing protein [Novosphingobium guangzhouense]|uniref:DNA-binding protein n=1 Tax=Novosphingobium guangzhouense TaxID=1850347 RepID=A0A2K2G194_9SPHN|nr:helix-turn-helix domain-containing protein [Novosphingobium guangzhouense]PNU04797.1 DNA-binding protein [Novosphingobium guangzhouense]